MPNDLEVSLVKGGVAPAAAKIIANAITNVASSQLSIGRRYGDATPAQQLRMVDADTRKYVLGNLDQPRDGVFSRERRGPSSAYQPRDTAHSYQDSQPATAQPTLTANSVAAGDYVQVSRGTQDSVSQSKVTLNVRNQGGQHARLNPATGSIESVPFLVENDQEQFIEAKFEERAEGTVLKLRLRNLDQMFTVTSNYPSLIGGTVTPNNQGGVTINIQLTNLAAEKALDATNIWAWLR